LCYKSSIEGRALATKRIIPAVFAILCVGCGSPGLPEKSAPAPVADPVKITAFYARDGVVIEGGSTVLCYGVSNAKSVRLDPPVEKISPSLNRCIEVRPRGETRYTLIAEGSDGRAVSESVTVRVGADQSALPRITSFQIDGTKKDYSGQTMYTLSFAVQNAEEVSIDPPAFPTLHGAPSGQFSVKPDKTTVYTLIVKGKNGHVARKQLTVEVP
jgi:hypothetical protein